MRIHGTASRPKDHPNSQLCTWLIIGIYLSRSVCMSRVAGKIPGEAKLTSATRRLSRLLDNPAIRVRAWYEPIAREWLEAQFRCNRRDPFDHRWHEDWFWTSVADCLPGLSEASLFRLPGLGSNTFVAIVLLESNWLCWRMSANCSPQGLWSFWLETTEFGPVDVLRQLDSWSWLYVLRQKTSTQCLVE